VSKNFRKFDGTVIEDVPKYVLDCINKIDNESVHILVGCDSQPKYRSMASFTTVIGIVNCGKGTHLIFRREHKIPFLFTKSNSQAAGMADRLWKEVEKSIEVGQMLRDGGVLDHPKVKRFVIHVDINSDEKWDSNILVSSALGYINSLGFDCEAKPNSPAATYAADHVVRGKEDRDKK